MITRGYERYFAAARAELGDRWDEECAIGRGMGIEEAVDLALDDD